ncbi:hypothetical protein NC651_032275 [Populus alba x Populus x berolinensis]|nr:hypothetical protein NC651_032275 [Populus alba x Populus x berolinensis]
MSLILVVILMLQFTHVCLTSGMGIIRGWHMVYELLKGDERKGACPPDGKTYNALIKLMTSQRMPDDGSVVAEV